MGKKYTIFASTLKGIANAVRQVTGTNTKIPVNELDDVLSGKSVSKTLPEATQEIYLIEEQTLIDIADIVRKKTGSTEKIPVLNLAERILSLKEEEVIEKLGAPTIRIETEDEPNNPDNPEVLGSETTAILGKAILGKAILGNVSVNLPKLSTPVIYLREIGEGEITKLDTPIIRLETMTESDEDVLKLTVPVIRLVEVSESDEPEEPVVIKLNTPNIYLETVEDAIPKLDAPNIYLESIE